jgi:uncharacterized protein YdbL (DUF1318 family)
LQLHDEQQQQQRRLQLLESQKTLLESMKILDQGRDADRQGELAKAFQLYKVGLAMAIPNLKLWPVINPMIPLIDECRSRVLWTMGRSEKISAALAAWAAVTEHPMQMMIQAFQAAAQSSAEDVATPAATSSSPQHGVASGTEQREPLQQFVAELNRAHPMPEMRQHKQVAQQQAQQPQQVAKQQAQQQVAREPQQQHWQQVGRVEGQKKQQQQQQQQQQQLQEHQKQQPEHQQLEDRTFGPRQPLNPPPNRLLQVVKPTAVSKAIGVASGVASEVAHKKQRVEMREEVKEEQKEGDVSAWTFLQQKFDLLRD